MKSQDKPRIYYSQNGEDCVLWALFDDRTTPSFFVEVGALDGTRFSNTYSFEQAGWRGICVEAHPDYIDLLKKNRPKSLIVHAAVFDEDRDSVTFYANSRGSLSTLDPTLEEEFRKYGHYFTGWELRNVPMRTLTAILAEAGVPSSIDILSIDIEGTEMAALRGLDLDKYRPRVMVIESRDEPTEKAMDSYLAGAGYTHARKISNNIFYCRDKTDVEIIANAPIASSLTHTPHPCDVPQDFLQLNEKKPSESLTLSSVNEIINQTPTDYSEAGNPAVIQQFISDPKNVFLISFPRTGSHWLRMLVELYFDRPTLTRIFYKHTNSDYLFLHDHDIDLIVNRENVIYLYRDPVDTVFSQLNYYREGLDDFIRIEHWAELYGKHLAKWLSEEKFTRNKLILKYEELRQSPLDVIKNLSRYYHVRFDEKRAAEVIRLVSRATVREKTEKHDPQVQNTSVDYERQREIFRLKHSRMVWDIVLEDREYLIPCLNYERAKEFHKMIDVAKPPETPLESASQESDFRVNRDITEASQTITQPSAKIVGLVAARNEEKFIGQCLRALSLYTDAIVFLDDASDDKTVAIVESLAEECGIEEIIRKDRWFRDEPGDRNKMLQAGRAIGGTHFIVLDADEMFTATCLKNNYLRDTILKLTPGEILEMVWIQLWRSKNRYRFDHSVWTGNYKPFIFCDNNTAFYLSDFIHTTRNPHNLSGTVHRIDGYGYGVLHFQFINWRNLLVKQAWYRCLERIRTPQKSAQEINDLYAPSKDETDLGLKPAPGEWFDGYEFFDSAIFAQPEEWREKQVLGWFTQYGKEFFRDLDIWDIDWGSKLTRPVGTPRETSVAPLTIKEVPPEAVMCDKSIKVSAIVSTYNSERFMRGCIEDLVNQTLYKKGELEIVVVNSGSKQNEEAIVKEFQEKYPNIQYIKTKKRETLYKAWNRGIKVAKGEYITNANTDDRHRYDALERMAEILDELNNVGLVYANSLVTTTPNETFALNSATRYFDQPDFSIRQSLIYFPFGPQPMWRRLIHDRIGFFNHDYSIAGDYDFFIRVGWKFGAYHISENLGLYLASSGVENQNQKLCIEETQRILHYYRTTIPLEDIYQSLQHSSDRQSRESMLFDFANCLLLEPYPDYQLAEQYFNQILLVSSNKSPVLNDLAVCLYLMGRSPDSIQIFQELSIKGNPSAQQNLHLVQNGGNKSENLLLIQSDHPFLKDLPPLKLQKNVLKPLSAFPHSISLEREIKKSFKIGMAVLAHERPDYLEICLDTLFQTNLYNYDITFLLQDDGSKAFRVREIIERPRDSKFKIARSFTPKGPNNAGAAINKAIRQLLDLDVFDIIGWCDPDALFHPEWLNQTIKICLWAKKNHQDHVLGPFSSFNSSDFAYHRIIGTYHSPYGNYVVKRQMGMLNYFYFREDFLKLGFFPENKNDETLMTERLESLGIRNFCTETSYIEHIGQNSVLNQWRPTPVYSAVYGMNLANIGWPPVLGQIKTMGYFKYIHHNESIQSSIESNIKLDILMPIIEKDLEILPLTIDGIRKNLKHPIGRFIVIAPQSEKIKSVCDSKKCEFLLEDSLLPIAKQDIHYAVNGIDRSGWLFQQLIKLSGDTICSEEYYLAIDADTILLRPQVVEVNGKIVLLHSDEHHQPYFDLYKRLFGKETKTSLSFVSHQMLFKISLMRQFKDHIEERHGDNWLTALLKNIDFSQSSGCSEYELFGQWMLHHHNDKIVREYFFNISLKKDIYKFFPELEPMLSESFRSISFHSYNINTPFEISLMHSTPIKQRISSAPFVSIFMPNYNGGNYIGRAIESILTQTFRNFQLIIADDGSTDKSLSIAKKYEIFDPRIKVVSLPHRGEVAARNEAIKHIDPVSKYLLNHDSDDISFPTKLEKLVEYLETHPDIAIVGCFAEYFNDKTNNKGQPPIEWKPERIRETFGKTNSMIHSAALIRREVFETIGGYRKKLQSADDYDFFARALLSGFNLANIPEVFHKIRLHPKSIGSTRTQLINELVKKIQHNYNGPKRVARSPKIRLGSKGKFLGKKMK
jgi:FkbM family methyltransferase